MLQLWFLKGMVKVKQLRAEEDRGATVWKQARYIDSIGEEKDFRYRFFSLLFIFALRYKKWKESIVSCVGIKQKMWLKPLDNFSCRSACVFPVSSTNQHINIWEKPMTGWGPKICSNKEFFSVPKSEHTCFWAFEMPPPFFLSEKLLIKAVEPSGNFRLLICLTIIHITDIQILAVELRKKLKKEIW